MIKKSILALSFPALLFSESLNNLIEMSLKNKNVMASEQRVEAVQEEYKSAQKGYLPVVNIGAGYTDVLHETAAFADNSLNAYVDVSYELYDGGKKDLTYQSYESQIEASKEALISLKNQVSLVVVEHYFNYLTYVSEKDAKLKEIEQLNAQHDRLSKFLGVGTTTIDEVDRIVSNKQSANVELHQIELNIQTVLHKLTYLTGQKVSINEGSYIEINHENPEPRNDIKALKQSSQTQLLNAKNVKTANNPQISLDNKYTYYMDNYNNSTYADNAIDDQNVFSINATWEIFDFGSNEASYQAAYKSFLSSKSEYEYEKFKANVDLNLAIKSYEINEHKIKSAEAGLKAAISTYDIIKSKYENGLVDNVSYLEALSDQSDAESSLYSAKYALEVSKANVMYQRGKNVWEYVK
nr:TolC family protein [uncultured Sulfurimonas sp.]